ncbi:MAG: hypothetical protein RL007_2427 [Bacteroidota bacterium]|jgi:glycosyltransferase involved in cell wall biosynthesis
MGGLAVSVVLPVYNGASLLPTSVNSILKQTLKNFELIIVNDGSTDETESIAKKLATSDERIKLVSVPHSGVALAFNAGIEIAQAEYIARMDADDEMHPERLQKQKAFLDHHSDIGVVSSLVKFGGDRNAKQGYALHVDWINTLITHEDIFLNRFVESPVCNPSVMFRKCLIEKHGAARHGNFPEDYEMWLRWMQGGARFAKVEEELHIWNDPPQRITRNDDRYSNEAFERAKLPYLIEDIRKFHNGRAIYVCGAGRVTRQRSDLLLAAGIQINGYIDVDPSKVGKAYNTIPVYGIDHITSPQQLFILSTVGNRGARESIRRMLIERNFTEGSDFILAQ